MVGFTSWCSNREPKQVFELLGTVYEKFDEIADRRGVFKVRFRIVQLHHSHSWASATSLQVETIGDCYVGSSPLAVVCCRSNVFFIA